MKIKAKEVLDSRGNPTVEVEIKTNKGVFKASVPSGASTGKHEAHELRDNDKSRYSGKGVLKAVNNVNKIIAPRLEGKNPSKQEEIDNLMIKLDNTKNKSKLGANAILAVSMAVCRAGAAEKNIPLYKHIQQLSGNKKLILPTPMVLLVEGGKHATQSSDLQEFMIMPKAKTFKQSLKKGTEVYNEVKNILKKQNQSTNIGFEGAFGVKVKKSKDIFELIIRAIKNAGYEPGKEINIAIDAAASEFYKNKKYKIDSKILNSKDIINFYTNLVNKYPITSIEDPLDQDDWNTWTSLTKKLGNKIQVVGDDLLTTNPIRIKKAIKTKACNALLLKINQIGTITESIKAYKIAKKANYNVVVSHRSGETNDSFIADLVVGLGTGQIKTGAPSRPERLAKYNQLLRIEEEL
ncbi:MAG: phosphopyruvate hydratase [archaeon]